MGKQTAQFKGLTGWVEVFKGGRQVDSKGVARNFSDGDLDQIIANHNPEHPPAHVITHRKLFSPFRYGDLSELKRDGDTLLARSSNIDPAFNKLVEDRRLPDRSVGLAPAENGWKIDHLAWLGAEPPAIDGLAPVEFTAEAEVITFSTDWRIPSLFDRIGGMLRRWRERIIEKDGIEAADEIIPSWEVDRITEDAAELRAEPELSPAFSSPGSSSASVQPRHLPQGGGVSRDPSGTGPGTVHPEHNDGGTPMPDDTKQFTQADLDKAKQAGKDETKTEADAEFQRKQDETQAQLKAERTKRLRAEFQAEVTAAIDGGARPADLEGAVEFMCHLAESEGDGDKSTVIEFSRGEKGKEETVKEAPLAWFSRHMEGLKGTVEMGSEFEEEETVDTGDANALANAAVTYQKEQADKGIALTVAQAMQHVTNGSK